MLNRTAKFASAAVAGFLASAPLTAFSQSATPPANTTSTAATPAADDCLAAPKDQTPQGSHWYYRIDRATKRHCWYLRDEGDAHAQTAAPNSQASAKPVPPKAEAALQGSVANARAELTTSRARSETDTNAAPAQLPSAAAANAANTDNSQHATTAQNTNMPQTAVASRWPDQLSANSSDDSAADDTNSDTAAQSSETAAPPPVITAAAPAPAPVTLAAADTSAEKQSGSVPMLLMVMTGALAVAGLVGAVIVKFGGKRRNDQEDDYEEIQGDRRPVWGLERTERARPLPLPASAAHRPNIGMPRELRAADDPDDKITEMLARLAKSAQS